jgi:hypothetical protein
MRDSFQGSSIDGKITVFDLPLFFVNRKWIYTAFSQLTELKNVFLFAPKESSTDYDDTVSENYLCNKKQDLQHGRPLSDNNVTDAWLKAQFGKVCHDCGDCFRFDIEGKAIESNLPADRMDNAECHHLNNSVPLLLLATNEIACE